MPVRPLRLSPITATAGGRANVTPGTARHQLAAVTPTSPRPVQETCADARRSSMKPPKSTTACGSAVPSPALIIV